MRRTLLIITGCLLLFTLMNNNVSRAADKYSQKSLTGDQLKAQELVSNIPVTEVLGPLAPVALSPFFGMACLSGTSILSSHNLLPENDFLTGNEALNNPMVFATFLLLTIATSVPRFTTVTKTVAEATDQLETYAGIISYGAVFMMSDFHIMGEASDVVYTAGIISFSQETLLLAVFAINIFVISSVKFFFELLVWISPIPLLDAAFEFCNKTLVAVLAIIYAFNPWLALVINLVLFGICLLIFRWCNRRLRYLKNMLLEPAWIGFISKLFGRRIDPSAGLVRRLGKYISEGEPLIKVFPLSRVGKIKKKSLCMLYVSGDELMLASPRMFRPPKTETLNVQGMSVSVNTGIISNSIDITGGEEAVTLGLAFSHSFDDRIDELNSKIKH